VQRVVEVWPSLVSYNAVEELSVVVKDCNHVVVFAVVVMIAETYWPSKRYVS
jgi:hypothetical protein